MNYIPWIALGVSVFALIISALSLWNSWRARRSSENAQHHTQIVAFGQRKQEIRHIIFETQQLLGESRDALNRAERELRHAEMTEADRVEISKTNSDLITAIAGAFDKQQACLKDLIDMPSSPSTDARLILEGVGGLANQLNKRVQDLLQRTQETLKLVRDSAQSPSN